MPGVNKMMGAIIGDICGSPYEFHTGIHPKTKDFILFKDYAGLKNINFTDDTVLTVAVAEHLLTGRDIIDLFHDYFDRYPNAGFGAEFWQWCYSGQRTPYGSNSNGSAMRTSTCGYYSEELKECLIKAEEIASVTHNSPEGINGAKAVTHAIFLARKNSPINKIKEEIINYYGYDLNYSVDNLRRKMENTVECEVTVISALIAFFESTDYIDAVKNAILIGGDCDTRACITGSIAEAYYKHIPESLIIRAKEFLPDEFLEVIESFYEYYDFLN